MKISYSWLKEFLNFDMAPEELAKHLLMLGFEVSNIQTSGPGFEGVVVGEILAVDRHPNADRLSLCSVRVGGETLSIVCGAKNVAVGARVPVARVGAKLPGGRTIERAKIRGTESQGMICSAPELGLARVPGAAFAPGTAAVDNGPAAADGNGILILPADAPVGADAAKLLGEADRVLEVEITPNRPDCLSHLGLARELSIYFHTPLKPLPAAEIPAATTPSLPVDLEAKDACRRYVGLGLEGLRVGPSPGWLARRLDAVSLRPINNVVDATNYVLFELGHPLHAFDAEKLAGDRVRVRFAKKGEKLRALDGKEYALAETDLVIADAAGPVAIAGIMGGEPTGVTLKTTRVFLEAAHFDPGTVRRASRRLGLRSDSSYRFERGSDPELAAAASARAASLILRLCGGKALTPTDAYPGRREAAPIPVSASRVNQILGADYPTDRVENVLKDMAARIEPETTPRSETGTFKFHPPSWRQDLATPWDLAEEVARHLGYERIPEEAGPVRLAPVKAGALVELSRALRERLITEGFCEAYNVDFVSEAHLRVLGAPKAAPALVADKAPSTGAEEHGLAPVRVLNPLSEDQAFLRPTLLLGLLQNAAYNLSRGAKGLRLFELGRVYRMAPPLTPLSPPSGERQKAGESTQASRFLERSSLAGLALGTSESKFHWLAGPAEADESTHLYAVKGAISRILGSYVEKDSSCIKEVAGAGDPLFHPAASVRLELADGGALGAYGLLHPAALQALDLQGMPAAAFVIELDRLAELPVPSKKFKPFSIFPSVVRDLSILLDESVPYGKIEGCLRGLPALVQLNLIDVYTRKGIAPGKKSLTLRLTFSSTERTLRDEEVQRAVDSALDRLAKECGASLRS